MAGVSGKGVKQTVGRTYAERKQSSESLTENKRLAPRRAVAKRDKYVTPNPWKKGLNPKQKRAGWKLDRFGKDVRFMAVESGNNQRDVTAQPSRKACVNFLDKVLGNKKFETGMSINKSVKQKYVGKK